MALDHLDAGVNEVDLVDAGFEVVNIVSTIELNLELNLDWISSQLSDAEYRPERSPFLVYRPPHLKATSLIPTNGTVSIAGTKSKEDLAKATGDLLSNLSTLGVPVNKNENDIKIQNVVISSDFNTELDLSTIAVSLGLEKSEYEPEQFPGLIYRSETGATILIFRTGKYLITGVQNYEQGLEAADYIINELENIGVDVN